MRCMKKIFLFITAFVFLILTGIWYLPEIVRVYWEHDFSKTEASDDNYYDRPEECNVDYDVIKQADPLGMTFNAQMEYCGAFGYPDFEEVKFLLRLQALWWSYDYGQKALKNLRADVPDLEPLWAMFEQELTHAKADREKSAEELYQIAKNPPESIRNYGRFPLYISIYMRLAEEKGHPLAIKERAACEEKCFYEK